MLVGDLAADRRRRGGLGAGPGARRTRVGRDHRLRRERRLGGALPGGGRLRTGRLRRCAPGGRGALAASSAGGPATAPRRPAQDVVVTVTPGDEPGDPGGDLRAGQHIAVLGADAHGKARSSSRRSSAAASSATSGSRRAPAASSRPRSRAGDRREDVTGLGDVLTGAAQGRRSDEEITLFDSTGLAIQDLAIVQAVYLALARRRDRGAGREALRRQGGGGRRPCRRPPPPPSQDSVDVGALDEERDAARGRATHPGSRHAARSRPRRSPDVPQRALCLLQRLLRGVIRDFLELPTSSMIFTTATSPPPVGAGLLAGVLFECAARAPSRNLRFSRGPSRGRARDARRRPPERGLLPAALRRGSAARERLPQEPLERGGIAAAVGGGVGARSRSADAVVGRPFLSGMGRVPRRARRACLRLTTRKASTEAHVPSGDPPIPRAGCCRACASAARPAWSAGCAGRGSASGGSGAAR